MEVYKLVMKIGVVTYHKADNYGAMLQAFALAKYLDTTYNDVEIVDYWPHYHAEVYKLWKWDGIYFRQCSWKSKIKYVVKALLFASKKYIRHRNFARFSRIMNIVNDDGRLYDAAFYGSDTIWNIWKNNELYSGFDSVYWGNEHVNAKYKFSYAPSMGNALDDDMTKAHCQKYLSNFKKISVRENQLRLLLNKWGYNEVTHVVDPTCLLTKEQWDNYTPKRLVGEDYILCYNLERSFVIDKTANEYALRYGLKVVYLTPDFNLSKSPYIFDTAGPFEFLSLYKYASRVVTSSFHGVIFSLLFEKTFVFNSNHETERIESILSLCGLNDHFIYEADIKKLEETIDYILVSKQINQLRTQGRQYIAECLSIANGNL